MTVGYVARRVLTFFVVILIALTINFFVPRLVPADPIRAALGAASDMSLYTQGGAGAVEFYEELFGLDQPLWKQYANYLKGVVLKGELGFSIQNFPAKVTDVLLPALPWTLGLLAMSTIIAWVLGTGLGALMAWPRAPTIVRGLVPVLVPLSAVPYYLLALVLIFAFSLSFHLFPLGGAHDPLLEYGLNLSTVASLVHHGFLPALSLVLAAMGFWAMGMRALMVSVLGEDYLTHAEAKGLPERRIFLWYGLRNALVPQTTALALAFGGVASGAVLVEIVFAYPGIGSLLIRAVRGYDYFVIQGCVLLIILGVALAVLIVDLLTPLMDPRVTYEQQ